MAGMEASKEKARRKLICFTEYTFHKYITENVHRFIAGKLDDVIKGTIKRLIITAPPQSGKSELVSIRLPAKWFAHRPDEPIILSSYSEKLASNKSWQARNVMTSQEYVDLFPNIKVGRDTKDKKDWHLEKPYRGYMLAAGVGGAITGRGAMLGIIDDPSKNWEEAQSKTMREKVWDWYRSVFYPRIWENGAIVIVLTRWHEDDLVGKILKEEPDEWEIIRLSAIAETQKDRIENNRYIGLIGQADDPLGREPGEALCPKRFGVDTLLKTKKIIGSMMFSALYQGIPRPAEGDRIKRSWFKMVKEVPRDASRVRYWDFAASHGGGAYTAGVLMAKHENIYYIEDIVRGQWSTGERHHILMQTTQMDAEKYEYEVETYFEEEPGSSGKDVSDAIIKMLAGYTIYADRPTGSKDIRMEPFIAQAEAGNIKLKIGSWNKEYIEELIAIPNGTYRDQADATSGAFNKLALSYEPMVWRP